MSRSPAPVLHGYACAPPCFTGGDSSNAMGSIQRSRLFGTGSGRARSVSCIRGLPRLLCAYPGGVIGPAHLPDNTTIGPGVAIPMHQVVFRSAFTFNTIGSVLASG